MKRRVHFKHIVKIWGKIKYSRSENRIARNCSASRFMATAFVSISSCASLLPPPPLPSPFHGGIPPIDATFDPRTVTLHSLIPVAGLPPLAPHVKWRISMWNGDRSYQICAFFVSPLWSLESATRRLSSRPACWWVRSIPAAPAPTGLRLSSSRLSRSLGSLTWPQQGRRSRPRRSPSSEMFWRVPSMSIPWSATRDG